MEGSLVAATSDGVELPLTVKVKSVVPCGMVIWVTGASGSSTPARTIAALALPPPPPPVCPASKVQATPLKRQFFGGCATPLTVAPKPKDAASPIPKFPFQDSLATA